MLKCLYFHVFVLSFSQIWLNLPMDDFHFGYITQALIHSFPLETFLPSDCTNFLLEKRKRNQAITNLFCNPFPSIRAIKLKSERVACKNNHLLTTHFESKMHLQLAYMYFQRTRTKHGFTTRP
jgi:hypothetical protein